MWKSTPDNDIWKRFLKISCCPKPFAFNSSSFQTLATQTLFSRWKFVCLESVISKSQRCRDFNYIINIHTSFFFLLVDFLGIKQLFKFKQQHYIDFKKLSIERPKRIYEKESKRNNVLFLPKPKLILCKSRKRKGLFTPKVMYKTWKHQNKKNTHHWYWYK